MVGYRENDTVTSTEKLFVGGAAGVVTRFLTQPLEMVKLRSQIYPKPESEVLRKKWFRITRTVYNTEGVKAFFQGHNVGQVQAVITTSIQFYSYEVASTFLSKFNVTKRLHTTDLLCGLFSGLCSAVVTNPLEVVRVRQMLVAKNSQYGGIVQSTRAIYRSGGPFAFFEGLAANMLQTGPQFALAFAVFASCQPYMLEIIGADDKAKHRASGKGGDPYGAQTMMLASAAAANVAAFLSKTATYPFDLVKKRMQLKSHKDLPEVCEQFVCKPQKKKVGQLAEKLVRCTQTIKCLKTIFLAEGLLGLYHGYQLSLIKNQVSTTITFTAYEMILSRLRNQN